MIRLQKYQMDAYKKFEKDGYVLVDAYRRAGKTELLKQIILHNQHEDIGIFCPSYAMFKHEYGTYFEIFRKKDRTYMDFSAHILLCDEFVISPTEGKKIACVITGLPKITKWKLGDNKFIEPKEIKKIRKQMTKDAYKCSFGNYV